MSWRGPSWPTALAPAWDVDSVALCGRCLRARPLPKSTLCAGCVGAPPAMPTAPRDPLPQHVEARGGAPELEPCPTCRQMSGADHRRVCAMGGRPMAAPAPLPPEPWEGDWSQDADGQVYDANGEPWTGDDDPPGIDVLSLPVRPTPGKTAPAPPTLPQERAARVATARRSSGAKKPRKKPVPWTPLPPPIPDTPWRVTRDVQVRTLSPNRIVSEHFRSRASRRNREHKAIGEAFRGAMPPGEPGWIVTFTRVGPALLDHGDRLSGAGFAHRDQPFRVIMTGRSGSS